MMSMMTHTGETIPAVNHEPLICIIIVNYNGYDDTINCLDSLRKILYPNFKIMVIDNASVNDSVARIATWLKSARLPFTVTDEKALPSALDSDVTIIRSRSNLGFGGANNIGFRFALGHQIPYVLLLNNDTTVDKHFLDYLLMTVYYADNIGMVGGKIYHMDGKDRIWYCGGWIDYIRGAAYHAVTNISEPFETTLVTGCLALVNMRAIREVGLFDERYFLNVEDWDLSYRMQKAGWQLIVDPQAIIYHKISGSIGGPYSLRNQYYFHRNRLLFFSKNLTPFRKFIFFFVQTAGIVPVWLIKQICRGRFTNIKAFLLGTRDFLRGKFGKSSMV